MNTYWLNNQNNKNLIVFFAGWSFDETPFKFLDCKDYDVLIVYDYNEIKPLNIFQQFNQYENKILITWSMGVFAAYILKNFFENFDYKIAINGTVTPVDNESGIPVKMFELTLKHAEIGLAGKFYKNVFKTNEEFEKYMKNPAQRTIENRISELEKLYELIKTTEINYTNFYDIAFVSEDDKIIPPQNQKNSHDKNNVTVKNLSTGHFPFYQFNSWDEIIKCK